jgi:hypothetical protein
MTISGPRVNGSNATRYRQLGLEPDVLRRSNDVIAGAVADGHRDRRELGAALEAHGISVEGQRLPHMLMNAELEMVICSGAMRGKQQTYAAFDERVPSATNLGRDAAMANLARRYFLTRGPATADDFAWWSGFTIGDTNTAIASITSELERHELDGRTYWLAQTAPPSASLPRVDFVQCYDETIISYRESRDVLHTPKVTFRTPYVVDGFTHVVLIDGQLLGHWRLTRSPRSASIETRLQRPISAKERPALDRALARVRRFFEVDG